MKRFLLAIALIINHFAQAQDWHKLDSAAQWHYDREKDREADSLYRLAIEAYSKKGSRDTVFAEMARRIGLSNLYLNRTEQAIYWLQNAIQAFENQNAKGLKLAAAYDNVANLYWKKTEYSRASNYYELAKSLYFKLLGNSSTLYLNACSNLAAMYKQLGFYEKSLYLYKEVKETKEIKLGKEHVEFANACQNMADLLWSIGDFEEAEPLYRLVLQIREQKLGKKHPSYASACNGLAILLSSEGEYAQAEAYYLEAKGTWEQSVGKKHPDYAAVCNNLANLYKSQGMNDKAERFYLENLDIKAMLFGKKHPEYASACHNLAGLYKSTGKTEKALALYLEAKQIREEKLGKTHTEYASSCNNLANLYVTLGDYEKAYQLYVEAKDIQANTLGANHPNYAATCNNLAIFLKNRGRIEEALSLFIEAKKIKEAFYGNSHEEYALACNNLASAYWELSEYKLADSLFSLSMQIRLKRWQGLFPTFSEKERVEYMQSVSLFFNSRLAFLCSYAGQATDAAAEAFDQVLFTKGAAFASTKRMKEQLLAYGDSSLLLQYQDWKRLRIEWAKAQELSNVERKQMEKTIDSLFQKANDLEKILAQKSAAFASITENKRIRWQDLQHSLGKNEVAVELLRVRGVKGKDTLYAALIVTGNSQQKPCLVWIGGGHLENSDFSYYKTCLLLKKEDNRSYNVFWKPIDDQLKKLSSKGFQRIYIAADGIYHQISLSSLKQSESAKYLMDVQEIHLLGSSRDLLKIERQERPLLPAIKKGSSCFIGAPVFAKQNSSAAASLSNLQQLLLPGLYLPPLPGALEELSEISYLFSYKKLKNKLLTQESALEDSLKKLESPVLIHIATHGFFVQNPTSEGEENRSLLQNPLNRSGLLMASCLSPKTQAEDGILSAAEAMNLSLEGTELLVLSACETGLGDVLNGEGVFGLQRAFRQAGAKSLLMSLWKIDDLATQDLMICFYKKLLKGKTKRMAFKEAQEHVRKKYGHPYYWAGFVMVE